MAARATFSPTAPLGHDDSEMLRRVAEEVAVGILFNAKPDTRISDLRLNGVAIEADTAYKVADWGVDSPSVEGTSGMPVWGVVESYLTNPPADKAPAPNVPRPIVVAYNPGYADA
jgi:hypothetical protein